jgi:hypothetical protein
MYAVITIDQRSSRSRPARFAEWAEHLNERFQERLVLPFTQTVGDEIQGVTQDPDLPVDVVLMGVRDRQWWLGLGVGAAETPFAETAARSRGEAFYLAREAVTAAKGSSYGFAVHSHDAEQQEDITAVLNLLAFIIRRRGPSSPPSKRWEAADLARSGVSVVEMAQQLGIRHQSASERLQAAGVDEENAGRRLAAKLMGQALKTGQ